MKSPSGSLIPGQKAVSLLRPALLLPLLMLLFSTIVLATLLAGCEYEIPFKLEEDIVILPGAIPDWEQWRIIPYPDSDLGIMTINELDETELIPAMVEGLPGLPAASSLRRLEWPNQMPNGDFQVNNLDGWSAGAGSAFSREVSEGIGKLNYQTIQLSTISYNLDYLQPGSYKLFLSFHREDFAEAYFFQITNDSTQAFPFISESNPTSQEIEESLPFSIANTSDNRFRIGSAGTLTGQNGRINSMRIGRVPSSVEDVSGVMRENSIIFEIPYSLLEDRTPPDGTYLFSLYARKENAEAISPNVPNRFAAPGLYIEINGIAPLASTAPNISNGPMSNSGNFTVTNEWQRFSVRKTIDFDEDALATTEEDSPVIRLTIGQEQINWDIGSILIASPEVVFLAEL